MAQVVLKGSADNREILNALKELQRENERLKDSVANVGRQSKRSTDEAAEGFKKAKQFANELAGALGVGLGVAGAVQAATSAYREWREEVGRLGEVADQSARAMLNFALLQQPGTVERRIGQVRELAAEFAIPREREGELFGLVQAAQSTGGRTFEQAQEAVRFTLAASQVGIPLRTAEDISALGAVQGAEPGQRLAQLFVAGQQSKKTPEFVAGAAGRALGLFEDPVFGMSLMAAMAGPELPRQELLGTAARQVAQALGDTTTAMAGFRRLGVGPGATREQRLRALAEAGIDTEAELQKFGITGEERPIAVRRAIQALAGLGRIQPLIEAARPEMLMAERARLETEAPRFRRERIAAQALREFQNIELEAAEQPEIFAARVRDIARAQAITQVTGRPLGVDAAGRAGPVDQLRAAFLEGVVPGDTLPFTYSPERFMETWRRIQNATERTADRLEELVNQAPATPVSTGAEEQ